MVDYEIEDAIQKAFNEDERLQDFKGKVVVEYNFGVIKVSPVEDCERI